jgi:hypothetical protein
MNALGSCYEDYGLNTVFLIINSCGDPFLVLVEPTINIESLAVYLQLHWIDLLMIKLDILYIKKKRKEKEGFGLITVFFLLAALTGRQTFLL